jgi:myo-inositol 2-dehydrogenase/D-chiro-inositol 1-dehydrogenase
MKDEKGPVINSGEVLRDKENNPSFGIGIVGAGRWGKQHIQALSQTPGGKLVALAARSPETAQAMQVEYDVPCYTQYEELLARPEVDAVIVATPNYLHFPVALAALKAGKHVLVEKPMSLSVSECDQLIEAAKAAGKVLFVGHEFRQFAIWREVKRLLSEGAIGQVRFGDIQLWRYPYRSGSGGWKQDPAKVGNWLLEEPVHYFDLAGWFFSGHKPRSIYARGNSRTPEKAEVYENFTSLVDFDDNSYVNITRIVTAYNFEIAMRFTGTEGVLKASWQGEVDISQHPRVRLTLFKYADQTEQELEITQQTGHAFELARQTGRFLEAIQNGQPDVTGEDGRQAVLLCEAALTSIKENRAIEL